MNDPVEMPTGPILEKFRTGAPSVGQIHGIELVSLVNKEYVLFDLSGPAFLLFIITFHRS
jgi:hypothetical protein